MKRTLKDMCLDKKVECKNCKYIQPKNGDMHECEILMSFSPKQAEMLINSGFGCNKFKRKGEKNEKI